jgi:DNA polymerase-3 subunit beta
MRIDISRADLARLLSGVTKIVEARNTIPVLSMVRLSATADRVSVTATDLDIEASDSVPAMCQPGEVCVEARLLESIVKKLPASALVLLEQDGNTLSIKAGRSRFSLPTLPASDLPTMQGGQFAAEFDTDLAALFAPVAFAMSTEETRYYLNGIFLHVAEGKLRAVATDGHRLGRHDGAESNAEFEAVIVPRKLVNVLPKGELTVSLSGTKIRVAKGDLVYISKLVDGKFPDYQRVIPTGNDKIVTMAADAIRAASDRVSTISADRGRAVKFSIAPGQAIVSVNTPEGSAQEEISADYNGEPVEIGFNSRYVADVFGNFPAGKVKLALADAGAPALVTSDQAPELLCVLMPMRA